MMTSRPVVEVCPSGVGRSEVRPAGLDDLGRLARTMARAFQDDPAFSWAVPNSVRRARLAPRYFELLIERVYLPEGEVYLTGDGAGAALWAPPGRWAAPTTASIRLLPVMARSCRLNLGVTLTMMAAMESRHRLQIEPHYYLPFIGTHPEHRGKGYGIALIVDMLRRCDQRGVPVYLEATSQRNQWLYQRHGFEVLEERHWPNGGPPWWPMWRQPR